MHGVWVVRINDLPHEVGTVRGNQVPAMAVGAFVEGANQLRILLRASLDLKSVDGADIRSPDQFVPVSIRCLAIGKIGNQRFQVIAPVAVA